MNRPKIIKIGRVIRNKDGQYAVSEWKFDCKGQFGISLDSNGFMGYSWKELENISRSETKNEN